MRLVAVAACQSCVGQRPPAGANLGGIVSTKGTLTVLARAVARRLAPSVRAEWPKSTADLPAAACRLILGLAALITTASVACANNPPEVQWTREFAGTDTVVVSIEQTDDGGYVVGGSVSSQSAQGLHFRDWLLIKLDSLGHTQWLRTYGTPFHNGGCEAKPVQNRAFSIAGSSDSGNVVVIETDSLGDVQSRFVGPRVWFGGTLTTADGGLLVTGLDHDSLVLDRFGRSKQHLWTRHHHLVVDRDWTYLGTRAVQAADGGYVICAEELVKTDSLGNVEWRRTYDSVPAIFDVINSGMSEYAIVGLYGSPAARQEDVRAFLARVDGSGSMLWKKTYAGPGSSANGVTRTADGGYVIAGSHICAMLIRTDSYGNVLWTKSLPAGLGHDPVSGVALAADGGYVVGTTRKLFKLAPDAK
jgi:hypothetical protein